MATLDVCVVGEINLDLILYGLPKELVLDREHAERALGLRGKRIVATGTLLGAHTGHHHTAVLLTVTYLDLPRWK